MIHVQPSNLLLTTILNSILTLASYRKCYAFKTLGIYILFLHW